MKGTDTDEESCKSGSTASVLRRPTPKPYNLYRLGTPVDQIEHENR